MLGLNLSRVRQNLLRWNLKRRKAGRAKREKRGLKFIPLEFETKAGNIGKSIPTVKIYSVGV